MAASRSTRLFNLEPRGQMLEAILQLVKNACKFSRPVDAEPSRDEFFKTLFQTAVAAPKRDSAMVEREEAAYDSQ